MDLRQLRYVLAVYRHRMAARAADEFGVAQSTITMSVRRLEDELGASLFERRTGGVRPTESLRRLRRLCAPLLNDLAFGCKYVSARIKEPPVRISITGAGQPPGSKLDDALTRALAQLRSRHPLLFPRCSVEVGDPVDDCLSPVIEFVWAGSGAVKGSSTTVLPVEWSLVAAGAAGRLPSSTKLQDLSDMRLVLAAGLGELGREAKQAIGDAGLVIAESDIDPDALDAEDIDTRGIGLMLPSILVHPGLDRYPGRVFGVDLPGVSGSLILKHPPSGGACEIADEMATLLRKALKRPRLGRRPTSSRRAPSSDIDMRQLVYFTHLYEERSVVRAATRANIVQPALSMQLQKLERALRVDLFQRTPRGLKPASAADRLYGMCHASILGLEAIPRQFRAAQVSKSEALRVGLLPALDEESVLAKAVGATIEAWREDYPSHQIRVSEAYSEVLSRWTQEKALDLAIVLGPPPRERQLEFEVLVRDPLAVITNPNTDLLAPGSVDLRGVAELPLVLPSRHHGIRRLIEARFEVAGVAIEPKLEFDSMAVAISLVRSGNWATILPVSAVTHGIVHGQLAVHPIRDKFPLMRELWAVRRSGTRMSEPTRGFINLFKANFNRLLAAQSAQTVGAL
jgi:LysR family nitrogen assimilation transcriptional regulator